MVKFFALVAVLLTVGMVHGQPPSNDGKPSGRVELEIIRNSVAVSQVLSINNQGSVVGTREIADDGGATLRPVAFYNGKHGTKDIAIPESYTNFEPLAISDNELVVGYATRPLKHKDGSLRGVVWNPKTEEFAVLPNGSGDIANQAQDISADGKRITGYTTGQRRMRPALWEFQEDSNEWKIIILPTDHDNNPYLMSGQLMISPDGNRIAGCCTEKFRVDGLPDSSLYLWLQDESGNWSRSKLSDEQLYLRGINNRGEMAGSILSKAGNRQPCFVSSDGEFVFLELLSDDVTGEAKDINNASVIVGFSDDPPGTEGGPELCIWSKDGKARRLVEPGPCYGAIHSINDAGQMAGMIEVRPDSDNPVSLDGGEELLLAFRTKKK